jgi:hypothetical protein
MRLLGLGYRRGRKALVGCGRVGRFYLRSFRRHLDLDGRDPCPPDITFPVCDGDPGSRRTTRGQVGLGGGGSGLDVGGVRGCSAHCYPLPLALGVQVRQVRVTPQVLHLDYGVDRPPAGWWQRVARPPWVTRRAREPLSRTTWVTGERQALVRARWAAITRQALVRVATFINTPVGVYRPRRPGKALVGASREPRRQALVRGQAFINAIVRVHRAAWV